MQSKDFYILTNKQSLSDIPNDTINLVYYFYEYHPKLIDFSNLLLSNLRTISVIKISFNIPCRQFVLQSNILK